MANGNGTRRRRCPVCSELFSPRGMQRHMDAAHPDYEEVEIGPADDIEVATTITVTIAIGGEEVFSLDVDADTAKQTAQDLLAAKLDEEFAEV